METVCVKEAAGAGETTGDGGTSAIINAETAGTGGSTRDGDIAGSEETTDDRVRSITSAGPTGIGASVDVFPETTGDRETSTTAAAETT